eukprot:CAMPEP_0116851396 /NCGR_PEP_ID=MMETSP0418-20121206/16700_1 /TAXON_ID=1158023 /ORGANISM="Astrosyne radiata, Strain 13vi08-1A" /LENGTH=882 /DNA_ID=CAMNT_0004483415 /DNA_START=64 /DNA_END=2713 /DNA_ORIENTATION=-
MEVDDASVEFLSEPSSRSVSIDNYLGVEIGSIYVSQLVPKMFQSSSAAEENLPAMEQIASEVIDLVFVPKAVAKQLALAAALQTGVVSTKDSPKGVHIFSFRLSEQVTYRQFVSILKVILSRFSSRSRLTRQLQKQQQQAETQDEWMDLAERIDNIQGNDVWRSDPNCPLYERDRISARIDEFVHLMRRGDIFELMFTLRAGIGRKKFGLLHEGLFSKAMAGSKILVETYHNVVCAALDYVCDAPVMMPKEAPIPTDARLAFFNETRHSYGRTALLLSGGAALGFYHVGVVKTLMENGLMPRVIGGSSAGSLVCAMVGTRTDEECLTDLFDAKGTVAPGHYGRLQLNFFRPVGKATDPSLYKSDLGKVYHNTAGFMRDAKLTWQLFVPIGFRRFTSLLYDLITGNRRPQDLLVHDSEYFRECVRTNVGDFTFQEAFDRTGRILNITVTPQNRSDPPRLLNYLTAPHVLVWSAAVASSSIPGIFEANKLMVRDADGTERFESAEPTRFADGSFEQDLPMQQLSEMFNVNHFIISQANPHAVLFASFDVLSSVWSNPIMGMITGTLNFLKNQVRAWLRNLVELIGERRIAPLFDTRRGVGSQFFVQEYEGRDCDISLIPWLSHRSFFSAALHLIYNPTEQEFREWGKAAERETWKYIPAIKSHIAEEITLDRCVQRLRKRVIVEAWEKRRQDSTGEKMGSRVPSFFTSPSLVNMGGLGIGDQSKLALDSAQEEYDSMLKDKSVQSSSKSVPNLFTNLKMGWAGEGPHGNISSNSLNKSANSLNKSASGLFIDGEEAEGSGLQVSGIATTHDTNSSPDYIKTTNMARFYYRKTLCWDGLRQIRSHDQLSTDGLSDITSVANNGIKEGGRRKSKSTMNLSKSVRAL